MNNENINIFISGDFRSNVRIKEIINNDNFHLIFNNILPIIKNADISVTNLECPLIEGGNPIKKTGPNLKSDIKSIEAINFAGFNMVTLANNHMMDYGEEGLNSTIKTCKDNNIEYIGAGKNIKEAQQVKYFEVKGKRIAFINCCENEWSTTDGEYPGCNPINEIDVYNQVKEAKSHSDNVILIVHGGHEMYEYPSPRMKKLYHWFIDIGADAVIGHHTHCFSGYEIYNNKPIVYSLGNFIFDNARMRNCIWNYGAASLLSIDNNTIKLELYPYCQCNEKPGILLLEGSEKENWFKNEEERSTIIKNDSLLQKKFNDFVSKQEKLYRSYLEPKSNRIIIAAKNIGILPRRIRNKKALLYTNLFRTEAHRDIILQILQNKHKSK